MVLVGPAYKAEDEHGHDDNGRLVEDVDDNVRQQLCDKLVHSHGFVEGDREGGRNAFAETEPVQEVGKDRTDAAADNGKCQDDDEQSRNVLEKVVVIEEGGRRRDKDTYHAVIHGDGVGNPVDGVGGEPDYNCGQVPAQHGGKDRAGTVQEQWQLKLDGQLRRDNVQQ